MKIYFGASVTFDRSLLPVYQKIVSHLKMLGHTILSEHVADPALKPGEGISARQLFAGQAAKIEQADVMVAEVTTPSWGTAFLIEHALEKGKPVLALFYKASSYSLPLMIAGHPELYVEHYDEDTIQTVLAHNLEHFSQMKRAKGKLVVLDGADGSGKSTQTKLLLDYLTKERVAHTYISFPRYETSFHGAHVGKFLKGEFGGNTQVSPYLSSLAFALDRLTARDQIIEWLNAGKIVVADRYVSASLAHQGSKLDGIKQKQFVDWLYQMEYKEHKLPKEDIVMYLYVPVETAQKLLADSGRVVDQADKDVLHQKKSVAMYQKLVKKYPHWVLVDCVDSAGKLLSIAQIHEKILGILRKRKII